MARVGKTNVMKNLSTLFLFLFCTIFLFATPAQAGFELVENLPDLDHSYESSIIEYYDGVTLDVSNFKEDAGTYGDPYEEPWTLETTDAVIWCNTGIEYDIVEHESGDVEVRVWSYFDQLGSGKFSDLTYTGEILEHELMHFYIREIYARRVKETLENSVSFQSTVNMDRGDMRSYMLTLGLLSAMRSVRSGIEDLDDELDGNSKACIDCEGEDVVTTDPEKEASHDAVVADINLLLEGLDGYSESMTIKPTREIAPLGTWDHFVEWALSDEDSSGMDVVDTNGEGLNINDAATGDHIPPLLDFDLGALNGLDIDPNEAGGNIAGEFMNDVINSLGNFAGSLKSDTLLGDLQGGTYGGSGAGNTGGGEGQGEGEGGDSGASGESGSGGGEGGNNSGDGDGGSEGEGGDNSGEGDSSGSGDSDCVNCDSPTRICIGIIQLSDGRVVVINSPTGPYDAGKIQTTDVTNFFNVNYMKDLTTLNTRITP